MPENAMSVQANQAPPVPEPPLAMALGRMSSRVTDLEYIVDQLVTKLQPLLGPPQPSDTPGDPNKESEASDITNEIRTTGRRIGNQVTNIQNILERLEV